MPRGKPLSLPSYKLKDVKFRLTAKESLKFPFQLYGLPYFTRGYADTEYLISNPNNSEVMCTLFVFGKGCKLVKKVTFKLKPNCTWTYHIKPVVNDHAGHCSLVATLPIVGHILYYEEKGNALAGGEIVDAPLVVPQSLRTISPPREVKTLAFGYRALPFLKTPMSGATFISNPFDKVLSGGLIYYDQRCQPVKRYPVKLRPFCTQLFEFPPKHYGYACLSLSHDAVVNVLHFDGKVPRLAAAELISKSQRKVCALPVPQPRKKILFDDTHSTRTGTLNDWTDYEKALVTAGLSVTHHSSGAITTALLKKYDVFAVTMPQQAYGATEKKAISEFVSAGGGLLIAAEYGGQPPMLPTRDLLNYFGATDGNDMVKDPTNHDGAHDYWVVFDYMRNFSAHPVTHGYKTFMVAASCSLHGKGWDTLVETDDDSIPARQPVVIARSLAAGRILALGDSNALANQCFGKYENKTFGLKTMAWLLRAI